MGTWGTGPFDDDSALDFVDRLRGLPLDEVAEELERAVRSVAEERDYVGFSAGVSAVAAAALLSEAVVFPVVMGAFPLVRLSVGASVAETGCRVVSSVEVPDAVGDGAVGGA
ncbi:DUF4259 domain-containing protein, partial [Kitasatospora sp. NPDC050543]|uniref:DUF4259 domain-containing protein n=1 Tax=Kitasatospora sp. NPDC050543 TaxID=3364054 RepID=UPI00378A32B3